MICSAHWERTGEQREAYKLDLCRDCYEGKPIHAAVELKGNDARLSGAELVKAAERSVYCRGWRESKRGKAHA